MAELDDAVYERVKELRARGDELADDEQYAEALAAYEAAWQLLPEPRTDWSAAQWILAAIGDVHFLSGDFAAGRGALMTAMKCDGSTGNPFLRLRLGQCMFELGEEREAANWMAGAYLMEGAKLFADEDPKYLAYVKSKLDPPPGGWPEGW